MMLCKKATENDLNKSWLGNKKFDGVRCLAYCHNDNVTLLGRSGKNYTSKFPEIVKDLKGTDAIFDGEIVCGTFQETQSRVLTQNKLKSQLLQQKLPAKFYIFDILRSYEDNVMNKPLHERIELMTEFFDSSCYVYDGVCELVKYYQDLKSLYDNAKSGGWEGIILKNPNSHYNTGRSADWLKLKLTKTKDITFETFTENPAGVRAETQDGLIAVQVSGYNAEIFKQEFSKHGKAVVEVEFLEQFKNGKLRMPVCKEVKV